MARSVKAVRDWLAYLNSEDSVAVYGQGSGAALVHCEGSNFMQIGGEVREKRERHDAQPLQLAISKLRALTEREDVRIDVIGDGPSVISELQAILECLEDGDLPDPPACECDNTHEQNNTVCRWCWARGRRQWADPEVSDTPKAVNAPVSGPSADPLAPPTAKHVFKADENLWLCSMGKRFRVTAIFTTDAEANEHMRKHDEQACIANFDPFVILADRYAGEPYEIKRATKSA